LCYFKSSSYQINPESAIHLRDLPALLRIPKARSGMLIVLLIGLAHFCAYSYLALSLKISQDLMAQPSAHYYYYMALQVFLGMHLQATVVT
jgi:predicted MFS family arabinose efflux permease